MIELHRTSPALCRRPHRDPRAAFFVSKHANHLGGSGVYRLALCQSMAGRDLD
jgi:hypothetical protein